MLKELSQCDRSREWEDRGRKPSGLDPSSDSEGFFYVYIISVTLAGGRIARPGDLWFDLLQAFHLKPVSSSLAAQWLDCQSPQGSALS